jgi:hypothetical protein
VYCSAISVWIFDPRHALGDGDWRGCPRNAISRSMTTDEDKLQFLFDRADISDVHLRYATEVDTRDWPLFRSCFTDEIENDSSSLAGGSHP